MPGSSSAADRKPDGSTCPSVREGSPTPVKQAHEEPLRLVPGTGARDECAQPSLAVQVILVTEGGLELPLVASPMQVVRLLGSVSEMAAGVDGHELLQIRGAADQRPHPVRTDQILSRVRVVVQRHESFESTAS